MNSIRTEPQATFIETSIHQKNEASRRRRAEWLASRIEQGASDLAAFAEELSDTDWLTPMSTTDRRTVGVVVHHLASMYPIEIGLAQAVAAGSRRRKDVGILPEP